MSDVVARMNDGARKAVELSLREALAMGTNYVGTEHLLLGLLREGGLAAQILERRGLTINDIAGDLQHARFWLDRKGSK